MRDLQAVLGWLKLSLERLSQPSLGQSAWLRAPAALCSALHREVVPCWECPPPAASRLEQNVQCAPSEEAGSAVSRETSGAHCSDRSSPQQFCPQLSGGDF